MVGACTTSLFQYKHKCFYTNIAMSQNFNEK